MPRTPLVSIGLPLYNTEKYLEQALTSMLSQTFTDFELVVCDNASTDRTREIVLGLAERDERIKYYRNRKNRGLVFNFNRVFELSRGGYFRWQAYDDFCKPGYLEECVRALNDNPEVIGSYSLGHQVDGSGTVVNTEVESVFRSALMEDSPARRMKATITRNGWSGIIHGLFRRDAMAEFMPYRDYFGADRLLLTQLAMSGKMMAIEDGLWVQRYHDNNSSRRSTRELAELLTGRPQKGLIFPMGKAFVDYIKLFRDPSLGPVETAQALAYLLFHGIRPDVVYNLLVPGPNNYFGLDFRRFGDDSRIAAVAVPAETILEQTTTL